MSEAALAGIRVLEVGNFMAGPFCTMQLADLGADVVKIENPDGGDQVRATAPFLDGESSSFIRLNRNKRSLALDLKSARGKDVFRKLARRADVLVENLRPGTMRDLELDYARLSELNPRLVYVAASGWGQDGPYSQRPGLDIMAQGMPASFSASTHCFARRFSVTASMSGMSSRRFWWRACGFANRGSFFKSGRPNTSQQISQWRVVIAPSVKNPSDARKAW